MRFPARTYLTKVSEDPGCPTTNNMGTNGFLWHTIELALFEWEDTSCWSPFDERRIFLQIGMNYIPVWRLSMCPKQKLFITNVATSIIMNDIYFQVVKNILIYNSSTLHITKSKTKRWVLMVPQLWQSGQKWWLMFCKFMTTACSLQTVGRGRVQSAKIITKC